MILGLPFANLHSAELKERMRYVDGLAKTRSIFAGKSASAELYESLCMRAVNQSIGEHYICHDFIDIDVLYRKGNSSQRGLGSAGASGCPVRYVKHQRQASRVDQRGTYDIGAFWTFHTSSGSFL